MGDNWLIEKDGDEELEVNHIDGNKLNNKIENLELVKGFENTLHGYNEGLYNTNKRNIKLKVFSKLDGKLIGIYKSIRSACENLSLNRKTVSSIIFHNKTNNYDYTFKPIIEEEFFFIQIFEDNKYIKTVPSFMQASEITGVDRHKIREILCGKTKNNTKYIFKKQYKSESESGVKRLMKA